MATAEQLITQHLDTWASTVKAKSAAGRGSRKKRELYGIKKLRELILQLAVRGLLVPQDPNDEPASELLDKLRTERNKSLDLNYPNEPESKVQLRKQNKQSIPKNLKQLPNNWQWATLMQASLLVVDCHNKTAPYTASGIPLIRTTNVRNGVLNNKEPKFVTEETYKKWAARTYPKFGDIIITREAPMGEACIIPIGIRLCMGQRMMLVRLDPEFVDRKYLLYTIQSPDLMDRVQDKPVGATVQHLRVGGVETMLIPLPPLAEQHRIVAKVDELMALCDKLEQQQENHLDTHATLVNTLLSALTTASAQGTTFAEAWTRIQANFDTLFTTESSIDQLKQTILQLAVMGKLVPQNPNDEPASELLKKIATEKAQLIKSGKIKKQKYLSPISENEKPFELPNEWEWRRFEDLVNIQSGITKGRKLVGRETITVPYLSVANVQRSYLNLENIKEVQIPIEEREKYRVLDGDLLITEGGDWDKVGRTAIWRNEISYINHQNHVFKARVFLGDQCVIWLEKYLNSPFSRDYFAGSSKQTTNLASINKTQLRGSVIALPPLAEQHRIVAKVDELLALCDTLKANLKNAQTTQLQLADTLVEKAIADSPVSTFKNNLIEFEHTPEFKQAALAAEIVGRMYTHDTFGQVKLQKVLYLAEHIAMIEEIDSASARHAAGPHDPALIETVEQKMQEFEWYETRTHSNNSHSYHPLANSANHQGLLTRLWPDKAPLIESLITQMQTWKTERCERFATLYAVWNDFLHWNQEPTDKALIAEVLKNWNTSKTKIPRKKWAESLQWMHDNNRTPTHPFGHPTKPAPQKELF